MTSQFANSSDVTVPAPAGTTTILQITDLHLYGDPNQRMGKVNCQQNFEAILQQALSEDPLTCDLILVTGDLVNEIKPCIYDRLFERLSQTGVPFACIAGNHDVTDELKSELPFDQRQFIAKPADPRLADQQVIETPYWQILLINSAVPGLIAGHISEQHIKWLRHQLSQNHKPALLALHHHIIPMDSAWIDEHIASGTEAFWQMISDFSHLKVIINGHTHQQSTDEKQGVTIYTTPATSYQFKPGEDEFAYDIEAGPGYRWIQLNKDGSVTSWVNRLAH